MSNPLRYLLLFKYVLEDVDPARFLDLALAGRSGLQGGALEKGHLDVAGKDVVTQESALPLDAIKGGVPPHRRAHVRHVAHNERVKAATDVAFPTGHGRDVGLHRGIAIGFRDLWVSA